MLDFFMDIAVGDVINIACETSFGNDHKGEVTDIKSRFDEITGRPYNIICCGSHEFDSRSGYAITSPTMYYISE